MMKLKHPFLFFVAVSLLGCASRKFYASTLPANPTSYVFPVRINEVSKVFQECHYKHYNGYNFYLAWVYFHGDGYEMLWSDTAKRYLSGEANKRDIRLTLTTDSSTVYHGENGRKLPYLMECKAHCTAVDSSHTRISVEIYRAEIQVGTEWLPSPPHFGNKPIYRNVEPTTVEEYKILLCFGKGSGIDNQMPPLKTN